MADQPRRTGPQALAERIEWAIGAVAAALVVAVIGFLVVEGLARAEPPDLRVHLLPLAADDDGSLRFAVENRGGTAVSGVVVSAIRRDADGAVTDKRSLTIDHVPPGSRVTGGFLPSGFAEVVVEGYVDP